MSADVTITITTGNGSAQLVGGASAATDLSSAPSPLPIDQLGGTTAVAASAPSPLPIDQLTSAVNGAGAAPGPELASTASLRESSAPSPAPLGEIPGEQPK